MRLARWTNRRPHTLKFCIRFTNAFPGHSGTWKVGERHQIWVQASSAGAEASLWQAGIHGSRPDTQRFLFALITRKRLIRCPQPSLVSRKHLRRCESPEAHFEGLTCSCREERGSHPAVALLLRPLATSRSNTMHQWIKENMRGINTLYWLCSPSVHPPPLLCLQISVTAGRSRWCCSSTGAPTWKAPEICLTPACWPPTATWSWWPWTTGSASLVSLFFFPFLSNWSTLAFHCGSKK